MTAADLRAPPARRARRGLCTPARAARPAIGWLAAGVVAGAAAGAYRFVEQEQQRHGLALAAARARSAAVAVDVALQQTVGALQGLAASPRLRADDLPALRDEAQELVRRRADWFNVILASPQAGQRLNTAVPPSGTLPRAMAPAEVAAVVQGGKPAVGSLVFSSLRQSWAFAVLVPVFEGPRVAQVLVGVVRPDSLEDALQRHHDPAYRMTVLLDHQRRTVAASGRGFPALGDPAPPTLQPLLADPGRARRTEMPDGGAAYAIAQRVPLAGWSLVHVVPADRVEGPVWPRWLAAGLAASGTAGGMAAAGLALAAWWRWRRPSARAGQAPVVPAVPPPSAAPPPADRAVPTSLRETLLPTFGHELRNPLAGILATAALLERDPLTHRSGTVLLRQARQLRRVIDELLDAQDLLLGHMSLQMAPVDLADVLRQALAQAQGLPGGVRIQTREPASAVWVEGDDVRLAQAVGHLLAGAARGAPAGSGIALDAGTEGDEAFVRVRAPALPAGTVADAGVRLGHQVAERIAALHGGRLVSSVSASGERTVGLHLPARAPAPALAAARPARVLLVEDNADLRSSLALLLRAEGLEVHEAADGVAGVESALREAVDVAFVDLDLPRLDGHGVARALRDRARAGLRLVAMSGFGTADDLHRSRQAGFDHHLVKPVEPEELLRQIRQAP
jgi:CheY-like chemotaxis protein